MELHFYFAYQVIIVIIYPAPVAFGLFVDNLRHYLQSSS
jgi:hypothetical protein